MKGIIKIKWIDYAVFSLSVFLVFCLIFESYLKIPALLGWLGRFHPLLLHFPIVILLICVFQSFFYKKVDKILLIAATLSGLITAISGFFLGTESNPKGDLLFWHQWLGGSTAILTVVWYWLYRTNLAQKNYAKIVQISIVFLVGITGHYGGMVTHGEDFLAIPTKKETLELKEDALVYANVIQPILNDKCVKCHNPNKQKGELLMTDFNDLLLGGKSGKTIIANDVENSELLVRLHLEKTDSKHMPPEGETPLTEDEIAMVTHWISLGASDSLQLNQLPKEDIILALIAKNKAKSTKNNWDDLKDVENETIEKLNSNYVTIQRIVGSQNALSVSLFNPPIYDAQLILDLKPIAENIVNFDATAIPLGTKEIDFITTLKNLERLEVDKTPITDLDLEKLSVLKKIKALKIYDTKISDKSIDTFKKWKDLKILHIWNTQITTDGFVRLESEFPNLEKSMGIEDRIQQFFASKEEKVSQAELDSIAQKLNAIIRAFDKPIITK